MEFTDLLTIDKGLSFILSILVIFAIYKVIKHAPDIISAFLEAFKNNTIAIDNSTEVIKDTKIMHEIMDKKIDSLQDTVDEMKTLLVTQNQDNSETSKMMLEKIEKMESDISALKKSGNKEGK
ncbi:MAG: hypothetical protein GXZ08_02515 [Tissierellia bacterium]|nr:hypothetical protein [Tissierellia bacterium]